MITKRKSKRLTQAENREAALTQQANGFYQRWMDMIISYTPDQRAELTDLCNHIQEFGTRVEERIEREAMETAIAHICLEERLIG